MTLNARLLILSRNDGWSTYLGDAMDRLGWRTITATHERAAMAAISDLQVEAVLIDADHPAASADLVYDLRTACQPRRLPIILVTDKSSYDIPSGWDMVFNSQAHPHQIMLRLEHMVRTNVAEEEYDLRRETFADLNMSSLESLGLGAGLRILSVGDPDPAFLGLMNTLRVQGAEVIGAFSSYSAFDYLHETEFDTVVLWGGSTPAEALSVAAGMRRNTRLYHTPVFLRLQKAVEIDVGEAYLRGVSDISYPETTEPEIADRILRLARAYRRQFTIRKALEGLRSGSKMDKGTGLFSRDLFASHLARLSKAAAERNRPLSVCVLKISETPDIAAARSRKALERAMPQIGSMISRLVRAEDTAGRLSPEVFALALPATPYAAAQNVGERIAAVIGCTAFEAGSGKSPFIVEFDVGVAELMPNEPAASALMRAAAAVNRRQEAV
ncbi:diguanylate cyclase [Asticcacaulis sp. SL142]|uniref:diguanylate cyclase domain-containing protein n=1 Tax=Asticcacaulis sp. SL142 TaxID=2995155 RepID=UPI00226C7BDA|nr:diguanylate cyclase [Asticcacaulis sp. SL142]WAC48867.1 diguanylate cyclase [Asticcacaulis sp. SL142]